jgi:hypothetical protein
MALPYSDITEDVLSVIKAPPKEATTSWAQYDHDSASDYNFLKSEIFQFKTRFIYDDNEKSVFSATSKVFGPYPFSVTGYEQLWSGNYYNRIRLRFEIPNDPTITNIELAVRKENSGIWYLVDKVKVSSYRGSNYDYYFYNSKTLIPLDQEDANRPYDYVPRLAGAQEIIKNNTIVYGDITVGYDIGTNLDVDMSPSYEEYTSRTYTLPVIKVSTLHYYVDMLSTTDMPAISGENFSIDIVVIGDGISTRYVLPASRNDSGSLNQTDMASFFVTKIEDDPVLEDVAIQSSTEVHMYFNKWIERPEVLCTADHLSYTIQTDAVRTMKDGAYQYYGLVYGDKYGRLGPVLNSADTEFDVPFMTQTGGPAERRVVKLDYQINHTPPNWAYTWRIVYGGSSVAWFQQFAIRTHDEEDRSIWVEEDGTIKIKINQGINDVRDVLDNYINPNYVWEHGDRLRIIGTRSVTGTTDVNDSISIGSEYTDYEIRSSDGVYIYINDWVFSGPTLEGVSATTDDILIEIYRLRKVSDENTLYYGIDQVHDITPSRAHENASGTIYVGECYAYEAPLVALSGEGPTPSAPTTTSTTTTSSTFTTIVEDIFSEPYGIRTFPIFTMYKSLFNPNSRIRDIGEPHIVNKDYREQRLNALAHSGPFIARTQVNELNRFDYDAFEALDDKHGTIYGLREVGQTLKVLQTSKNTSIYLGREYYVDSKGNEQLVLTDNVLGSKRPHEEEYGTVFSRSIAHVDRDLFYYDIYSGKIIRDMPNGQQPISLNGIDSYLRLKSRALLDSGLSNIDVLSGIDEKNGVVYFTFLDSNTPANDETIGYHMFENRWIGNTSFIPEIYSNMGDNMFISFKDGELYKHNSDSVNRNYFYGSQYSSEIHLVSNVNPQVLKSWDTIEVASNKLWTLAENDSIVIDSSTRYSGGMQSKILSVDWEEYEEVFRAAFNYDLLTGDNATANAYYLHNGRELRGRNMLLKLKNTDTSEVNLVLVTVNSKLSL